jgi:hypothetical protein
MEEENQEQRCKAGPGIQMQSLQGEGEDRRTEDSRSEAERPIDDSNRDRDAGQQQISDLEKPIDFMVIFAIIELCARILSWSAALGAIISAVFVSIHVPALRNLAVPGQLVVSF